ncbi:MAG: flavodoxin domain-containing protein, partial [Candidatus Thorarchaeota archaeon]
EDRALFSCDAFGAFGALNGKIFDDEIDLRMVESESKRYLSVIITSYFKFVQQALAKVRQLNIPIQIIAPSHGPVYRKDPMWIVERYDRWTRPELERYCAIVYASMYGYCHRLAIRLKRELTGLGVQVRVHNVSYSDISRVLTDAVHAGVLVIGTPTYDAYPFPKIWAFVNEIEGKRFPKRPIGLFGTFGWGGGGVKKIRKTLTEDLRLELIEPVVEARARPTAEEEQALRQLAQTIAERLKTGNFRD